VFGERANAAVKALLPRDLRNLLRKYRTRHLRVGRLRLGDLRRLTPISDSWGRERGLPVDRYYIEKFLLAHSQDVQGHVLEIQEPVYTRKFGSDRVTKSDVLHYAEGNPQATIVADLTCADQIPADLFDCIIFTQTLHMIYDFRAALNQVNRIMKPGGILLATFPGTSRICDARYGDYWRFTTLSSQILFQEFFPKQNIAVYTYGNVLAAASFLYGIAAEELKITELDYRDPQFEVLITIKAAKPS
jgi:Methyltransferase domain